MELQSFLSIIASILAIISTTVTFAGRGRRVGGGGGRGAGIMGHPLMFPTMLALLNAACYYVVFSDWFDRMPREMERAIINAWSLWLLCACTYVFYSLVASLIPFGFNLQGLFFRFIFFYVVFTVVGGMLVGISQQYLDNPSLRVLDDIFFYITSACSWIVGYRLLGLFR